MIKLYNFGPFGDLADASPFCLKVDAYLRMTGLEYECLSGAKYLKQAPKGKMPFISDQGKLISDTTFILDYLKQAYGDPLDNDLTEEQLAVQHAFTKMLDENLYWCLVWSRWISDEGWPTIKQAFFSKLPWPVRVIAPGIMRRGIRESLKRQGLGRHTEMEIKQIARNDFQALSSYLGQKRFFFGDEPASLDAVAYAFLGSFILSPIDSSMTDIAKEYSNLVAFCERVHDGWYGEAAATAATGE